MKIFYVANVRFPTERAHGIQIAKMCEALVRAGADVTLIVPTRGSGDPFKYYGLTEQFEVKRVWSPRSVATTFDFLFSSFVFGIMSFLFLLRHKSDCVYSMDLDPISYTLLPLLRRPYFFELHGPKRKTVPNRILFRYIAGIITIGERVKSELEKNFPRLREKIIVKPNGTDLTAHNHVKDDARALLGITVEKPLAVYTGSPLGWKGFEVAVEAATRLPDVAFYFVGISADDFAKRGVEIPENVSAIGRVAFRYTALWQDAADILFVTGTQANEYSYKHTSPMKLFEYMAARRPILACGTPAIRQYIDEGQAFFYEPDDAESFASGIRDILSDHASAEARVKNAFRKAEKLSWDNRAAEVLAFIKKQI
ncbi:hypothetical protein COU17_03360 [Candidatus Kaiserbacteria bacterium CG10_big_fil_rev_8_21_14_0_10_49_17]|uniref:Glycosyltransferase subfamily 4-like N-terminal domain-containing protein n=1 Tax=Candidatus Kaiserbacteria bacterium CG10_big_fil_rev_8_21_14_0_10_49_17 TaxID=1974609 RepID=A0A2M6WDZ4_9BACT|nr:MAG: hypothetical protein COU17_03360 [Candidatus Kaiserbacteria bacterium CG10_big_fil_rev_8_21_14_0_10_49_17]